MIPRYAHAPLVVALICSSCSAPAADAIASDTVVALSIRDRVAAVSEGADPVPWVVHRAAGTFLSNGAPLLYNRDEGLLMLFDSTGQIQWVSGGQGEGPGEFRRVNEAYADGDGFSVWDSTLRRISFFSRQGDHTRSVSLSAWQSPLPIGVSNSAVVLTEYFAEPRQPLQNFVVQPDGSSRTVTGPKAYPHYRLTWRDGPRRNILILGRECTPALLSVVIGTKIYVADTGKGTVSAVATTSSDDSTESRIIFTEPDRQSVSSATPEWIRQRYAFAEGDSLTGYLAAVGDPGDPLPAWSDIVGDHGEGRIYLRVGDCTETGQPRTWTVVDTSGAPRGGLRLPQGRELLSAHGGLLLASYTDSLGVEFAELYRTPDDNVVVK